MTLIATGAWRAALIAMAALGAASCAATPEKQASIHRLAIHVDDNDVARMNLALNNALNVTQLYGERGEEVEIEIVIYGPGLNMLREDRAPEAIKTRVKSIAESMPNVVFSACENTRVNMAKAEGKKPEEIVLAPNAVVVPAGVVRLIELQEKGWAYVRP
jgi:intracellular sulfur oxidation DsrE/DsrF family protein